jgi:hypothetical protein
MRTGGLITTIAFTLTAAAASAQTSGDQLSPLQKGIACAPPVTYFEPAPDTIRIRSSQTTEPRTIIGSPDMLVLSAGTSRGLAIGQRYFVRRVRAALRGERGRVVNTSGWISIVAVNDATAIASVLNACGAVSEGDFLEPFVAPEPPQNAEQVDTSGQLDFTAPARVLYGADGHERLAVGDFVLIDRGADQAVATGSRFAFYRDPRAPGMPLVAIGEAVVVSVGPAMALVRVNAASAEVQTSDYAVPRK